MFWGLSAIFSSKRIVHIQLLIALLIFIASPYLAWGMWFLSHIIVIQWSVYKETKEFSTQYSIYGNVFDLLGRNSRMSLKSCCGVIWVNVSRIKFCCKNVCIPKSWGSGQELPRIMKKGERHIRLYHGCATAVQIVRLWEVRVGIQD